MDIRSILEALARGDCTVEEGIARVKGVSESDLGFARIDVARSRRCGVPELVYGEGKTPAQISAIMRAMAEAGQHVLVTRVDRDKYEALAPEHPDAEYHELARAITLDVGPRPEPGDGGVVVVCAGTSDLPVAEEAVLTARCMGARTDLVADVGVAGLHRMVSRLDLLRTARVLVVVAGMEGALPSVIGGLVDCPIVAVPTSVGYGTSFGGVTALMAMLNSCVPGITVVNIDNGVGAGVAAALINRTRSADSDRQDPLP